MGAAHLLLSPEVDLRAVITTHASSIRLSSATSREKTAEVVQKIAPARSASLPVVAGSSEPLRDAMTPRENAGVDLLLRVSRDFSQSRRLIVFTIGASTDVASAILKDPSISNRITVVAMGFGDWPEGGDFFNVKNDPFAWQVILNSDVPLVIGSGTVGKRDLKLTRAEAATLMRSHGPTGEYLYSLFDDWLTREPKLVAQVVAPEAWAIWDEIVVAYVLGFGADTRFHALSCSQTCRSLIRTRRSESPGWMRSIPSSSGATSRGKSIRVRPPATAHETTACGLGRWATA